MKVKRTLTILIVVLFAIVSFVCTIFAFTVKSVNGDFTCTERIDGEDLQRKLDKYSGVNLLFFTPEEMIADIRVPKITLFMLCFIFMFSLKQKYFYSSS